MVGNTNVIIGSSTKIWNQELVNIYGTVKNPCRIGASCNIGTFVEIGPGVMIGNNVKIGAHCFIPCGVTIEDDCFIGPGVIFTNDKYPPSGKMAWGRIVVKTQASIGAGSVILPNVVIGKNVLVGAGSVVTKSIPKDEIVYGNPAQ